MESVGVRCSKNQIHSIPVPFLKDGRRHVILLQGDGSKKSPHPKKVAANRENEQLDWPELKESAKQQQRKSKDEIGHHMLPVTGQASVPKLPQGPWVQELFYPARSG